MKVCEFIDLQQGSSTVYEYATKLNALARYTRCMASTTQGKMKKFIVGLNPKIARDVMRGAQSPQTYSEASNRALKSEVFVNRIKHEVKCNSYTRRFQAKL